ncbi:NAD(P)-dependent alcohol dehydrogenase [Aspergillus clavatus NRRL 1]|uniref:NADP-dependent alcohol dehydrogenase n=1 Tax=Aspergillus clavatus (strain ATCC 1007 / CBS 513.65 / DSM 816 / NCTC 3887 / NRRL 1 / QM 1276 / 107) TaxID=344612 RepID=A1CN43_ASPCL|nr:NADP-dependent alcohol dehydrogenase [Aspergillus clavatus NRRL 1]EAW08980.1 NADP-dependent alcohol dehydrogenase [Aspergillus clavatus NRRL 1]
MGYDFTVYRGSKDGSIKKATTHRDDLQGDSVLVRVTHSGVCYTDVHYMTSDMALGHEGAGVVEATGPDVIYLKKGDRVGWGYEHDCCGHCKQCLTSQETFCPERKFYGLADFDQGSFATQAVWREAFLFQIPDGLNNEDAAPLMCGGSTVWNAMVVGNVKPTSRVGIVGIGGLGHLAIQFAAKMGCEVVVFSGTESKKDEAMKLGAREFYATKGAKELKIGKPLDNLIVTMSTQPDWKLYLDVLAPSAVISPLTVDNEDLKFPYMPLLANGLRIQGSVVAPRQSHRDMLEFAALHNIKPIIMTYPLNEEGIQDCLKTLEEGKMRYRGVLIADK